MSPGTYGNILEYWDCTSSQGIHAPPFKLLVEKLNDGCLFSNPTRHFGLGLAYQEEAIYATAIISHASSQFPHACSEKFVLKSNEGGRIVDGVLFHAVKICN